VSDHEEEAMCCRNRRLLTENDHSFESKPVKGLKESIGCRKQKMRLARVATVGVVPKKMRCVSPKKKKSCVDCEEPSCSMCQIEMKEEQNSVCCR